MLRFSGNSIGFVAPPVTLYLVSGTNGDLQFVDTSNAIFTNDTLKTLVAADIDAAGGAPATSKRYCVDGVTYAVDFTRFT
jgi:hypothetical protein